MGFSSVQNQGYFINVRNYIDNEENKNFFCGAHDIEGAFCPNCKKPLLRFMTIEVDGSVVKINKYPYKKIHFVYCWTCNLSQDIFYYQIVSDNKIEILKYKHGKEHDDFPYLDYPT